ncbi:GDSL-type esterase/lipase family protein [Campylobacter sp. MIT 97-5078]|uniref:GDSL-type esterase/lipase family protein n=1 Tax=Campylobacter sp. MIT 97-5078 TaxID=1548153 RepID=UPI00068ACB06|nr:GDSL-type esterase/lipase family protein [Campylobacter sp. MIT 97-5078]TQR27357.1 hypothetical protein DMB91_03620 [Campylobacter sp. MIT 97-5078]
MKKICFFLLCVFGLFFINACVYMSVPKSIRVSQSIGKKELLNKPRSALISFASSNDLERLKGYLSDKKNLKIRIFGDSHMAADFFSRELRKMLIRVNAIGFSYPLQPKYQHNLMLNYESKGFELYNSKNDSTQNYALGGISIKALRKNAFVKLSSNLKEQNFKFGVIFESKSKKEAFILKDSKGKTYTLKTTHSGLNYKEFNNIHFPISIYALEKGVNLNGFFIYNEKNNLILDTLGINGARSDLWLKWDQKALPVQLNIIKSDFIILAYGSNDVLLGNFNKIKFKENYKNFIAMLKQANPNAVILLISPPSITQKIAKDYQLSNDFYPVRDAIYELAKEQKLLLFDMHKFMQESGGKDLWIEQGYSKEDVHLSVQGYELMADKFYKDLKALLQF